MKQAPFSNHLLFPAIRHCHTYGFITQNEAVKLCDVDKARISVFFAYLVDERFMTFKKIGRTNYYKLTLKGAELSKLLQEYDRLMDLIDY